MKRIHFTNDGRATLCGTPYNVTTIAEGMTADKVTCLRCLFKMPLLHDERMARMQAVRTTNKVYVNHSLTLSAEPICGAKLVPPERDQQFVDCPACEAAINRTLDWLAKAAP